MMRDVCLDFHVYVTVDAPNGMEDDAVADMAYRVLMATDPKVSELEWDGYLIEEDD